mgnify:CR=1 FL=1
MGGQIERELGPLGLDPVVAGMSALARPFGNAGDVGLVADEVLRLTGDDVARLALGGRVLCIGGHGAYSYRIRGSSSA